MNRKQLLVTVVTIAITAMLTSMSAMAGPIYRYVDENGNVHYVDRPTGAQSEERLAIASRGTDNAAVQARYNTRYAETEGTEENTNAEAEEEQPMTRAERVKARKEREAKCQQYRDQLERYVTSRRLYREDENGERTYLDESQVQEARNKAQELVVEFCD